MTWLEMLRNFPEYSLWSLPERIWLSGYAARQRATQEEDLVLSYDYLWFTAADIRRCVELYQVRTAFLLELLDQVYRPLLASNYSVPFPVVAYLAVGYTVRRITVPRPNLPPTEIPATFWAYWADQASQAWQSLPGVGRPLREGRAGTPPEIIQFIEQLNRWLDEILAYDFPRQVTPEQRQQIEAERANWPALYQFIRRALSAREIGPSLLYELDPHVCDSQKARENLWSIVTQLGVETRLLSETSPIPEGKVEKQPKLLEYLHEMGRLIEARLPPPRTLHSAEEEQRQRVWQQQTRAVRYYLGRAGMGRTGEEAVGEGLAVSQHLLDFHALAGYQAFGKFLPDARIVQLLELLRRQHIDPTLVQHAQASTVEGVARRGGISQALKWQFTLPPEYVYDRFFNHKLLYLRRVSQRSQSLAATLLFVLDLSAQAHQHANHGGRYHSLVREACAHLLQDCYQVLWQVPKLFADAVIVMHDGVNVLWRTNLILSDGQLTRPATEDLFLRRRPDWLGPEDEFADPATYFHFTLPALAPAVSSPDRLEDQIVESVRLARRARLAWLRSSARPQEGALLATTDLLTTVLAGPPSRPSSPPTLSASKCYEDLHALALTHELWQCTCGRELKPDGRPEPERIVLSLTQAGQSVPQASNWSSLAGFQRQEKGENARLGREQSLRQTFVHELLQTLVELCLDTE